MIIADATDFRGLSRYFAEERRKAFLLLADFVIRDNTSRIAKRIAYDGLPQKANAASTVRKKGHSVPLRDKRILENPANYQVVSSRGGNMVRILVPPSRVIPLTHLARRGYRYWGVSTEARQYAQKVLGLAWENAKRRTV